MNKKLIGVLAIQGDFRAHMDMISRIGIDNKEVRRSQDLDGVTHLIIPGGESTTISRIAKANGLWEKIKSFEGPVLGTCMGAIMMAAETESDSGPAIEGMRMIDMKIRRNAYGRQIDSFVAEGSIRLQDERPFEMVFIRAPRIMAIGKGVEPIAFHGDEVTGVRSGDKIAVTFHPELSQSEEIHGFFAAL